MYSKNNFDTIRQYKLGAVVVYNTKYDNIEDGNIPANSFGHITGFDRNSTKELLVMVKWADGEEFGIHPSNIMVI